MHKQKISMAILLTGALALSLTACGSAADGPSEKIVVAEPGKTAGTDAAAGNAAAAPADLAAKGKAVFAACVACHSVSADGVSTIGPNLHGIVGRKAGAAKDFGYSAAMKASNITWTAAELDQFLANPAAKIPGTLMTVGIVSDANDRRAVIAYLTDISK